MLQQIWQELHAAIAMLWCDATPIDHGAKVTMLQQPLSYMVSCLVLACDDSGFCDYDHTLCKRCHKDVTLNSQKQLQSLH